jgi:hypothetical protein
LLRELIHQLPREMEHPLPLACLGYECLRYGGTRNVEVTDLRDSIYYAQLARKARQLASAHSDPIVARHLREAAVKHDRLARKLARSETSSVSQKRGLRRFFPFL